MLNLIKRIRFFIKKVILIKQSQTISYDEFKQRALKFVDLADDPNANLFFDKAWKIGNQQESFNPDPFDPESFDQRYKCLKALEIFGALAKVHKCANQIIKEQEHGRQN